MKRGWVMSVISSPSTCVRVKSLRLCSFYPNSICGSNMWRYVPFWLRLLVFLFIIFTWANGGIGAPLAPLEVTHLAFTPSNSYLGGAKDDARCSYPSSLVDG